MIDVTSKQCNSCRLSRDFDFVDLHIVTTRKEFHHNTGADTPTFGTTANRQGKKGLVLSESYDTREDFLS